MLQKFLLISFLLISIVNQSLSQQFDAEILSYSTHCEVKNNKLTESNSVIIQINNRVGDRYSDISIPYSKTDDLSDIEAWIEDMDGKKVRSLKKKEIIEKSAISDISLFEDNYLKSFELKHNVYPYKVVYSYKITYDKFIAIAWWTPVLFDAIPTRNADLTVLIPNNFKINKYANKISSVTIDSSKTNVSLRWFSSYKNPIKKEIFSQPEDIKPFIMVFPVNFKYGVEGSTKDWQSLGDWQYRLIVGLDKLPEAEQNTVSELIKGISDKKQIVKILYHYMQDHTRYVNVSIGIGGLKPYSASYVSENKYGDCKALTNYMKALLHFAGIESFYTKVYAGEQPRELVKSIAGQQFNHIVLAVPLDNDTIWLENTDNINPFGYMGTFTQNRDALLVSKDNSHLVWIPALKKEANQVSYKIEFDLTLKGGAGATLKAQFKGRDFEMFNHLNSEFNDKEKDRIIREYMPFDNYEVLNWELKKVHRDTARIELIAKLNLYKLLNSLGDEYYFSLYPIRIPSFSAPTNRTLPLVLPYPVFNSDTLIYNLPSGYYISPDLMRT